MKTTRPVLYLRRFMGDGAYWLCTHAEMSSEDGRIYFRAETGENLDHLYTSSPTYFQSPAEARNVGRAAGYEISAGAEIERGVA